MDINKEFEDWWDKKAGLLPHNIKYAFKLAFNDCAYRVSKQIPKCITEQGTTIGKVGADVIIQCSNADEAIEVLNWLSGL